nr:MAG TPA: hypothetical protein [Caudoviricetes sp.]
MARRLEIRPAGAIVGRSEYQDINPHSHNRSTGLKSS